MPDRSAPIRSRREATFSDGRRTPMAIQNIYHGAPFDAGATFASVIQSGSPAVFDQQLDHFIVGASGASILFFGHDLHYSGGNPISGTMTGFIVYSVDLSSVLTAPPLLVASGYAVDIAQLNTALNSYHTGNAVPFFAALNVVTTYNGSHDND